MSYKITEHGWFSEVNGHAVQVADATHLDHTAYAAGHAVGVVWHYTCGYQGNIEGSMEGRGYATAPFSVDRDDGQLYQYLPIDVAGWHVRGASHTYSGIEHEDFPGGSPDTRLTEVQLDASTALAAAIVEYVKDRHGYAIPLVHVPTQPGANLAPGFRDHRDGTTRDWNSAGHSDGLMQDQGTPPLATWDQYLARVQDYLAPRAPRIRWTLRVDGKLETPSPVSWRVVSRLERRYARKGAKRLCRTRVAVKR